MARLATRQPFTAHGQFITRKAFPFDGRPFNAGVEFPYEELRVGVDKLRKLLQAGFIRRVDEGEVAPKQKKVTEPKVETKKTEEVTEDETEVDDEEEEDEQPKKKKAKKSTSEEDKKAAKKARAAARRKKG